MKKTAFALAFALALAQLPLLACTHETGTPPVDAPIAPVATSSSAPLPPPDPPRTATNRLPSAQPRHRSAATCRTALELRAADARSNGGKAE